MTEGVRSYKQITIWENRRRVLRLEEFHSLVVVYFYDEENRADREFLYRPGDPRYDQDRREINLALSEIVEICRAADLNISVDVITPVEDHRLNVLVNIFTLWNYDLKPSIVTDILERATGVYRTDYRASLWRTINPLWWAGQIPFFIMRAMGFNIDKIQGTAMGRLSRLYPKLSTIAALFPILQWLGWNHYDPVSCS